MVRGPGRRQQLSVPSYCVWRVHAVAEAVIPAVALSETQMRVVVWGQQPAAWLVESDQL